MIMPAISPIYGQNPGYGLLQIDTSDYTIQEMSFRFFQLENYFRMGISLYRDLNIMSEYGVDLNSPTNVRSFNEGLMYNF